MVKIPKSAIDQLDGGADTFARAVDAHAQALRAHRMTVGEPRPMTVAIIEAAIKRVPGGGENGMDDFVLDYEIEDDTPPTLTPRQKRDLILNDVRIRTHRVAQQALKPGKRRLIELDQNRIMMALQARQSNVLVLAQARAPSDKPLLTADIEKIKKTVEDEYGAEKPDDLKRLEEIRKAQEEVAAIERRGAEVESYIEDIPDDQIDAFELPLWLK